MKELIEYLERKIELCTEMNMPLEKFAYTDALKKARALQLQQTGVSGSAWIEVLSDHEITEYSKKLEPIWIVLEEDESKIPILCQPDGHDNYYGSDDIIYHYCDISHFMKIQRPVF